MAMNARRKHHNIICYDDAGNAYQSLSEALIFLDFKQRQSDGYISEPARGRYKFEHGGVKIGTYTSDMEFSCLRTFAYLAPGGTVEFFAGQSYVVDVKSPATITKDYRRTRLLMQAFHGVILTEILTARPRASSRRVRVLHVRAAKSYRGRALEVFMGDNVLQPLKAISQTSAFRLFAVAALIGPFLLIALLALANRALPAADAEAFKQPLLSVWQTIASASGIATLVSSLLRTNGKVETQKQLAIADATNAGAPPDDDGTPSE
jgi:hypothetical protein